MRADGRVEGFFAQTSVERGEQAVLKVRCDDPEYRVEVYRSGYYGDTGGRLVEKIGPRTATPQPDARRDERTGLVSAAGWSESVRFDTSGWPSGVYLARLIGSGGSDGQALLVVRDRTRAADALVIIPDTTYQAYNYWGDYSFYAGDDGSPRAVRVSFDRPYINVTVDQADWYLRCELPLVRWLEAEGYDVTYAAASDLHRGVELGARGAWISCGHSEYWSDEMRAAFEGARDRGVHLAFFGANSGYWRVRFEADPWSKEPDRVMVCYKMTEESPTTLGTDRVVDPVSRTTLWRDPAGPDRPENALIGIMYVGQDLTGDYPVVVPAQMAARPPLGGRGPDAGGEGQHLDRAGAGRLGVGFGGRQRPDARGPAPAERHARGRRRGRGHPSHHARHQQRSRTAPRTRPPAGRSCSPPAACSSPGASTGRATGSIPAAIPRASPTCASSSWSPTCWA